MVFLKDMRQFGLKFYLVILLLPFQRFTLVFYVLKLTLHPHLFLLLLLAPLLVVVRGIIRIIVDHLLGTHLSQGELHLTPVLLPVTTVKSRVTQSVIVVSFRTN